MSLDDLTHFALKRSLDDSSRFESAPKRQAQESSAVPISVPAFSTCSLPAPVSVPNPLAAAGSPDFSTLTAHTNSFLTLPHSSLPAPVGVPNPLATAAPADSSLPSTHTSSFLILPQSPGRDS